jgi:TonB family protein
LIADKANRAKVETQARVTSTDRDDANPTPGSNHAGPADTTGDADETRIAQSEDRAGEQRAPSPPEQKVARLERKAAARPNKSDAETPRPARAAQSAVEPRDESARLATSADGTWQTPSEQKAQAAARAQRQRPPLFPKKKRSPWDLFGLDSTGTTENGVSLSITTADAVAVVGREQLIKDKKRDAELRRSRHRGTFKSAGLERWKSAIENYVPSVKPGNTTDLNTAAAPFASYLNTIHNRLHPIFADSFLGSLDGLPDTNPLSRMEMSTNLEIVVSPDEGRVVRLGVTKTSGVTAFDVAALESVHRAQPFGAPPKEIVSPDGNVYLHWEFYRNPMYACSTYFARPFLLKAKPETGPTEVAPPPRREGPPEQDRHGELPRDRSRVHASK